MEHQKVSPTELAAKVEELLKESDFVTASTALTIARAILEHKRQVSATAC